MIALRIASLIHSARNRLVSSAHRLRQQGNIEAAADIEQTGALLGLAMTLFRQGRDTIEVYPAEVDLEAFFKELADEIGKFAPAGLATDLHADLSGMPYPVWLIDSQLVQLVLLDALMNAWRHAASRVNLTMQWRDGQLCFEIRDDGPGFQAAWLANEYPADQTPVGTGMGLPIARQVAARHTSLGRQGRIELENRGGAVFRILLP